MNQAKLTRIFALIRNDCSAVTWSTAVELARGKHVMGLHQSDDEARFRVELPDARVAPEVSLFPEDEDWVCSCNSPEDPCAHVAAAIIALKRAKERGEALPSGGAAAVVHYRFEARGDLLALRRILVHADGEEKPFWGDLTAVAAGKKGGPRVAATDIDLQVDRAMAEATTAELPARILEKVLILLRGRDDVTLDGDPIEIAPEQIGHCLVLHRVGDSVEARCKLDPRVVLSFQNGAVLTKEALHPSKRTQVEPKQQRFLSAEGVTLRGDEIVEFVARDLPLLRKQMLVAGDEALGVSETRERPYVYLESWRQGLTLFVRPLIGYGKPLQGLVRGERFEALGSEVPARLLDEERLLRDQFARDTSLDLGRTYEYAGTSAVTFVESMRRRYVIGGEDVGDFSVHGELSPQLQFDGGAMQLAFKCGATNVASAAVMEAWQQGDALVPLTGGGFAKVPQIWLDQYGRRVQEIFAAQEAGATPVALASDVSALCRDLEITEPEWIKASAHQLEAAMAIESPTLPDGFRAKLRGYQREGILWLQRLRAMTCGGLLCDDMGLGKTVQAIAALQTPALVVAPNSLLRNWQNELEKFRPGLSINVFHGANRSFDHSEVVITTYHTLRQDAERFTSRQWETAVFDESQLIKNPDSQIAQAAYQVAATQKFALTGTPLENRLEDIWSQMHLVMPGFLGSLSYFRKRVLPSIRAGEPESQQRLKSRLQPFLLRRLKSEVAKDLPVKTEIVNRIELTEQQQALYQATLEKARQSVEQGRESAVHILTALLRLRQICAHPALFDMSMTDTTLSAKFLWLIESLQELKQSGNKALLFSQWTSLLDLLEPVLEEAGVRFLRLDGKTPDRQHVVDQFSAGEHDILIMSLKAGGVGLNLTIADHVFLFDPWWNPAAEAQAIDRTHRIGQDRPVFVHKMIALDTVEERVLALQERKSELSDLFVGDGMQESRLDREELLSLVFGG